MTKNILIHIGITLLLLFSAVSLNYWSKVTHRLNDYAAEISSYLSKTEAEAMQWAHKNKENGDVWAMSELETLGQKDFTLVRLRGDSLIFWSNNKVLPQAEDLKRLAALPERTLYKFPLGQYYVTREGPPEQRSYLFIPIRYSFTTDPTKRQYLFPAGNRIPDNLEISQTESAYPIVVNQTAICWLPDSLNVQSSLVQWYVFLLAVLFLLAYFSLANQVAMTVADKYHPGWGSGVLIGSVILLVAANAHFKFTDEFQHLSIFAQKFKSPTLGNSLGEWLLYIIVLLWSMVFFHREFTVNPWGKMPATLRILFGSLYNIAMMGSIVVGIYLLKQLVFESGIVFDFDNILNFNRFSLLAVLGIILLLAGLFLFSHRMTLTIFSISLTVPQRMLSTMIAGAFLFLACMQSRDLLNLSPGYIVPFSLVYVVAFDAFIDKKQQGFAWIVTWLFLFSIYASFILYRFYEINDHETRLSYAKVLGIERDSAHAEPLLTDYLPKFKQDGKIDTLLRPILFNKPPEALLRHLSQTLFGVDYLFQHYNLEICAFSALDRTPAIAGLGISYDSLMVHHWQKARPIGLDPDLRLLRHVNGNFSYLLHRKATRFGDPNYPVDVFLFFHHQFPKPTKVYSQLFYNRPFMGLAHLDRYDFAIFKNGSLLAAMGEVNPKWYNPQLCPKPGGYLEWHEPTMNRTDLAYSFKEGDVTTTVTVGRPKVFWRRFYVFTMVFTLLSFFMIALAGVNSLFRFLPDYYKFYITLKGSLAKRIQYSTLGLIVVSFILIGVFSYLHFSNSAEESERSKHDYRAASMLSHISELTEKMQPSAGKLDSLLSTSLESVARSFSVDANLYGPDGTLQHTTQRTLERVGAISPRMNQHAFQVLQTQAGGQYTETEQLGSHHFQIKYVPLVNGARKILGFVGLPHYLSERNANPWLSDFIGIIATLYVFLLVAAGVWSVWLANGIIRPINLLGSNITTLRLEDKNQPLVYEGAGQDELSTLIKEFNEMVNKIEASKVRMARLEREAAWKEMARQVAHDIKNPLTAMKLSLQHLQRLANSDLEILRDTLRRAIGTQIEQIDSLAYIATEFSMFFKLEVRREEMLLNETIQNVFDLFTEMDSIDFSLKTSGDNYTILGDKNHLMRVFNNLVVNATQAIPSDRRGSIHLALYRRERMAVLRISDNGAGIPDDIQQRVFDPNFTTKTSGSGLGLAISKRIIEMHDGNIYFDTRENDGTDFYVELPLYEV